MGPNLFTEMQDQLSLQELALGMVFSSQRVFTGADTLKTAEASRDFNRIHFDDVAARKIGMDRACIHGACYVLELSRLIGNHFFVPGTIVIEVHLRYPRPIYHDELATFRLTVADIRLRYRIAQFSVFIGKEGTKKPCADGDVKVMFPLDS